MVERAQRRMREAGLTSRGFAKRHADLSRELVRAPAPEAVTKRAGIGAKAAGLALCCAIGGAGLGGGAWAAGASFDPCGLKPTFADDFDTLSVSAHGETGSRWIAHTPWNGDFGDAAFTDPGPGFPFRVRDGILEIEARKGSDGKWRS